jgi:molecular chaperone GrpE
MSSNEQSPSPSNQSPGQAAGQTPSQGSGQSSGEKGVESQASPPANHVHSDEVTKLTAERAELNDRLLRLAAEFENYKRRIRKETEEAGIRALESLLKEILGPLDNLDRALVAARANETPGQKALVEGVQLVQKQFFTALEKFQVKPFDLQPGQPFDPTVHEAVQQVENDTLPPGSVGMVFQRGYFIGPNSRLLRPAVVAVVRGRE